MRTRLPMIGVLTAVALVARSVIAAPTDGVWMVTGGGGAKGDCMSEFALQWDPNFDPAIPPAQQLSAVPEFSDGGGLGRVEVGQQCTDNADPLHLTCDRGGVPHECTFKVAVCFCVDDPATGNCTTDLQTRGTWCRGVRWNEQQMQLAPVEVKPMAYLLRSPSRTSKDRSERRARCNLEYALRGCVTDLDLPGSVPSRYQKFVVDGGPYQNDDECCEGNPACQACEADTSLQPATCTNPGTPNCAPDDSNTLVAPVMREAVTTAEHRLEALVPGERVHSFAGATSILKTPADDAGKSLFLMSRLLPVAGDPPLEREGTCVDPVTNQPVPCFGTAPRRRHGGASAGHPAYQQFVERADFRAPGETANGGLHPFACGNFAEVTVDLRRYRKNEDGEEEPECDCSVLKDGMGKVRTVPKKSVRISGDFWGGENPYGPVDKGGGDELRLTCLEDPTLAAEPCTCP